MGVGSMTTAMAAAGRRVGKGGRARQLRVAVVGDGRITDERTLLDPGLVAVAHSAAGVSLSPNGSDGDVLFEQRAGRFVLHLVSGLEGRFATAGCVTNLQAVRERGVTELHLGADARGRVSMGGSIFLFQVEPARPRPSRPQLPVSVRNGFVGAIDWFFTSSLALSLNGFFFALVFFYGADWPIETAIAAVPAVYADLVFEPVTPPEQPVESQAPVLPNQEATASSGEHGVPTPRPPRPQPRTPSPSRSEPTLDPSEVARQATLLLIGVMDQNGSVLDELLLGAPTTNAEDVFASVDSATVASNGDTAFRPRGSATGTTHGGLRNLRQAPAGGFQSEGPAAIERGPTIRVGPDGPDEPIACDTFDGRAVSRAVRGRLSAARACYEHEIGSHPSLAGIIRIEFTLATMGNVTDVDVVENTTGSQSLGACVVRTMRLLRMAPGDGECSATYVYPIVFALQE